MVQCLRAAFFLRLLISYLIGSCLRHESDILQGPTAILPDGLVCFSTLVDTNRTDLVLVKCAC